ncbi:MAG: N-6 DNA methylase [Bacteroidales bacterium]|nr:N-6 DNA methylase [Bacteroidales bacterium]
MENNIRAIEIALSGNVISEQEKEILRSYQGFGGIKAVLLPSNKPDLFSDSDRNLIEPIKHLHQVLSLYTQDNKSEYEKYLLSIKNSVLTSFYTPHEVVSSLNEILKDISFQRMLEPSAGAGVFLDHIHANEKTAIEKDLITGKILSALHPDKEIMIQGFEKLPRKYERSFDLVVSNIPFGTVPVFDPIFVNGKDKARRESSRSIHNYFFFKGMDMLQDGGVLAFISSTGVMDSSGNEFLRRALLKESHLISAVRLPNNLFINTGGIEVASDMIILQKDSLRDKKLSDKEKLFISSGNKNVINDYYHQELTNVVFSKVEVKPNQFGRETTIFHQEGGEMIIAQKMKKIIQSDMATNFNHELYYSLQEKIISPFSPSPSGQLSLFNDTMFYSQQMEIPSNPETDAEKIEHDRYSELKEAYFELRDTEKNTQKENAVARERLNDLYNSFIVEYDFLLNSRNILISEDGDYLELIGLERRKGNDIEKSDIFFEPVSIRKRVDELTVNEALNVSLNELNFIDLAYIGLLSGKLEEDVKNELLDSKQIYYNPVTDEYQIAAIFISGNVIEKQELLRSYLEQFSGDAEKVREIKNSIKALEDATPKPLPLNEIGINMGERWIPEKYYVQFSKFLFNPPGTDEHDKHFLSITYLPSSDDFIVKRDSYNHSTSIHQKHSASSYNRSDSNSPYAAQKYSVRSYNRNYTYDQVFRFALLDTIPEMTIKKVIDNNEVHIPDVKGIQEMSATIDDMHRSFKEWLGTIHAYNKRELETIYNNKFRNTVKPSFDGSFQTLPDLNYDNLGIKELYPSQKDTILMLKLTGGGIVDHEVGGGKTLIQCVAAYEMKRLGLVNKPAILGLRANIYDIAETYQKAYPNAKVLYPTKKELKSDSVDTFLAKIQNNNWDVIILSHEQFENIPQSLEVQKKIMNEELSKLEESLHTLISTDDKEARKAYKQLEKRKEKLTFKLDAINYKLMQHKGNVIDFKTMGIDHLFIDESHKYKNLSFVTRHTRAAGLGTPLGSQRSQNMLYAIRTIQEKTGHDLGATFLSGTTISNSLTELYNIFNYLRPQALKDQGIFSFDAWLATYAVKSKEFEFSVTNDIIQKERFRHFCKVPELATFYGGITDYKTAEMIGVDRPDKNEILVHIEQTPDQVDMYDRLKSFAKTADGELIFRAPLSESEERAKMLIATNTAMKASIDMRLINPVKFGDHENNKITNCVKNLLEYYKNYDHVKGTQFVFCDIGTYDGKKEWDVYSEIKNKLVTAGVPESEVQFIQNFNTFKKKKEFQQGMNEGTIRVGLGSTEMLGTGVNAQQRAVAVHHLDIPWTPKDFTQRNGRAVRAGNWVAKNHAGNKVDVFIYAVEKTLDVYKFNLQATKHNFISQIKSQDINVRTIDEGGMDEQTGMNYNDYIAVLSGDRSLLEKAQLERKLAQLKMEEKTFHDKIRNKESVISSLNEKLEKNESTLKKLTADQNKFNAIPRDQDGNIIFKIDITIPKLDKEKSKIFIQENTPLRTYNNIKDAGIALNSLVEADNKDSVNLLKIGELYGFDINIRAQATIHLGVETYENKFYITNPESNIPYHHNNGTMPRTPELAGEYFIKALEKIESIISKHSDISKELKHELTSVIAVNHNEFPKREELMKVERELKDVVQRIERNINQDKVSPLELTM